VMRMIESVDAVVARSGEDLWAEICSCLPHPDQKDAGDAFTDSFMDSYADRGSLEDVLDGSSHKNINPKPWAPLNDSEIYLASLVWALFGIHRTVNMTYLMPVCMEIWGLTTSKKECWDRFLQEKFESEFYVEGHESDESTLEHLKRWLHPDKVAISTEEVQYLIPPESQPEKQETEEEPPAAEQ
ncbi:Uncharacterized protein C15orf57, partial [Struthio camelus australis]